MTDTWNYQLAIALMAEKDLKRADVAKKIGLTYQSFGHALRGRRLGKPASKLLAMILECPEEELLSPSDHGRVAS